MPVKGGGREGDWLALWKWKADGLQAVIAQLCVHFSRLLQEMRAALNGTFDILPYYPTV